MLTMGLVWKPRDCCDACRREAPPSLFAALFGPMPQAVPPPPITCPSGEAPKLETKCAVGVCKDVWICRPSTVKAPSGGGLNLPAGRLGISAGLIAEAKAAGCKPGKMSKSCAKWLNAKLREGLK